jgi:inosose dehydratase
MRSPRTLLKSSPIGLVPLNWNFSFDNKEDYLQRIAGYGFQGIQISEDQAKSTEFLTLMNQSNLRKAEQYIAIKCDTEGPLPNSALETENSINLAKVAGVEMLVFAVDGSENREKYAARASRAQSLSEAGFTRLAAHIEKYAALGASLQMRSSFHQHAATYIETPEETRKLMSKINSELVGICLDVGHWLVGGGEIDSAISEYGSRITHVHVKDVSGEVLRKLKNAEYETMHLAVHKDKLFVPAGTGILDLNQLFSRLQNVDFKGWLMSEQDSAYEPSEEASAVSIKNIKTHLS